MTAEVLITAMNMTNEEKVVYYVERFKSIVAKDGLEGFFCDTAGDDAQATLNALLVIGAVDAAALLRRAMWLFEEAAPPREQAVRRKVLSQISEDERSLLDRLNKDFSRHKYELSQLLTQYAQTLEERCCVT